MKKTILNYHIIVQKEKQPNGKYVYVTQVPTLGISDCGKTIEDAIKYTEMAIKLYVEYLAEKGEEVPAPDADEYLVVNKPIEITSESRLAFG